MQPSNTFHHAIPHSMNHCCHFDTSRWWTFPHSMQFVSWNIEISMQWNNDNRWTMRLSHFCFISTQSKIHFMASECRRQYTEYLQQTNQNDWEKTSYKISFTKFWRFYTFHVLKVSMNSWALIYCLCLNNLCAWNLIVVTIREGKLKMYDKVYFKNLLFQITRIYFHIDIPSFHFDNRINNIFISPIFQFLCQFETRDFSFVATNQLLLIYSD